MVRESRKIQLIEDVLKLQSDSTLTELEKVIKKSKKKKKASSIYDFVGVMSAKEIAQVKKAIAESSEKIDPNDWR
ncbi:MAG: hypothetical protein LW863_16445 [Flammeovirgaceae bacterium]|jgi:hypothetical protein|nr:hypothetical protein [Flammeovirgaceae bacterium]